MYQIDKYLNMNEQILASAAHASEVNFYDNAWAKRKFWLLLPLTYWKFCCTMRTNNSVKIANGYQCQVLAWTDKLYFKNAMHLKDE